MPIKITVSRVPAVPHDFTATETPNPKHLPVEMFAQTFEESAFDMAAFVVSINKRKRVRKARTGKDA